VTSRKRSGPAAGPRRRAEARARTRRAGAPTSPPDPIEDAPRLVQELEAHRIELEIQNDELRAAQVRAEEVAARFADLFEHSPIGYVSLDPTGLVHAVNLAAATVLGVGRALLVGRRIGLFVAPRDRARFSDFLAEAALRADGPSAAIELDLAPRGESTTREGRVTARMTARRKPHSSEVLLCVEDVSERRAMEDRLRETDRRKADFLVTLSHELRTPLSAILTATYVLERDAASDATRRAQRIIRRQAEHVTRLVEDLLDVSRIERGKLELRRSRLDLRELVGSVAEAFRAAIEERGVTFRVAVPDGSVWAEADATRLEQVIGNLVHNASKFTRRGDEIVVGLAAEGEFAEIRVWDSGAGIDAAVLPSVFGVFVQGERTMARSRGGLGVGLAVVKALTELHGGTVRAASAGVGQGSEFVVRLPAEPIAPGYRAGSSALAPPLSPHSA
jgi:PAS domain S-box-containing protein